MTHKYDSELKILQEDAKNMYNTINEHSVVLQELEEDARVYKKIINKFNRKLVKLHARIDGHKQIIEDNLHDYELVQLEIANISNS